MKLINNLNFEDNFEEIKDLIENATFIALDCEFTGLYLDEEQKGSIKDSTKERYLKCCKNAKNFIICQLGLTIAKKLPGENKFVLYPYQFSILPKEGSTFSMQTDAVKFLCAYNFDYNEWLYNGIPYLDETTEKEMHQKAKDGTLFSSMDLNHVHRDVQDLFADIIHWTHSKENEKLELDVPEHIEQTVLMNLIAKEYTDVTISFEEDKVILERVDSVQRKQFDKELLSINERYLNEKTGFSKVFQILIKSKKPLIGHNMLVDLFLLYEHFYKPLPNTVEQFKQELVNLFVVYDTKHISYKLKREEKFIKTESLLSLYNSFQSQPNQLNTMFSPNIDTYGEDSNDDEPVPHEAGSDAYMTAIVFIKMAHFARTKSTSILHQVPQTWVQCLSALKDYENHVNVINFQQQFWNLGGKEVKCNNPPYIYVRARKEMSAKQLSKYFGQYGVKKFLPLGKHEALVLVDNFNNYYNLLKDYKAEDDIFVTPYGIVRHSPSIRASIWLCSIASCLNALFFTLKFFKRLR